MYGRHWHGEGWHHAWGWAGPLLMALFWVLLAVTIVAALRASGLIGRGRKSDALPSGGATSSSSTAEAERILHERFARGEIGEDEYTRRHDLLVQRSGSKTT